MATNDIPDTPEPIGRRPSESAPTDARDAAAEGGTVTKAAEAVAAARPLASAGAEPSLLARQAHAGVDGLAGESERSPWERGGQNPPETGGRIDARAATEGGNGGNRGGSAAGGPVTSVGSPQGDAPGEAAARAGSDLSDAGIVEDVAGREGASARGGEEFDAAAAPRSMAEAARASADENTPNAGGARVPGDAGEGRAAAERHGTGETDWGEQEPATRNRRTG